MVGDMEAIICSEFQPTEFVYTEIPISTVFDKDVCFPKNSISLATFNAHISVAFANFGWRVITLSPSFRPEAQKDECSLYLYPNKIVGVCRESELASIVSFLEGLTNVITDVGEPDSRPAYSPTIPQVFKAFERHKQEVWGFILKVFLQPLPFVFFLDAAYSRCFVPLAYKDRHFLSMVREIFLCLFESEFFTLVELGKIKNCENEFTFVAVL